MKLSEHVQRVEQYSLVKLERGVLERITELEEKAEAFDWLSRNIGDYYVSNCSNLGCQIDHHFLTNRVFEGRNLLECVRKAQSKK